MHGVGPVYAAAKVLAPLTDVLVRFNDHIKPHSNGPLYSNTVIGTLAVYGWAVTFGTVRRGLGGLHRPVSYSLYQLHIIRCGTMQ